MATQAGLIDAMERWLPDDIDVPDATQRRDAAVTAALKRFGRDVPRRIAQQVTTNPVATSSLTNGWDNEFSEIVSVEWPYLTATAGILDKSLQRFNDGKPKATVDVEADGTYKVRFPGVAVSAAAPAFVTYTRFWTADTLPPTWDEAVTVLAAALLCHALAGVYEGVAMPEPAGLVSINAGERADSYREQYKVLFALYEDMVGLEPRNPITLRRAGEEDKETA